MKNFITLLLLLLVTFWVLDGFWYSEAKVECKDNDKAERVEKGKKLFSSYGCIRCHKVADYPSRPSFIGPPLDDWSKKKYISGDIKNTQKNLVKWIQKPHKVDEDTTMPDLNLNKKDAVNIAAYLMSL